VNDQPESAPVEDPAAADTQAHPDTTHEDQVHVTQDILEEVLGMLGEAWAENESLRAELAVLQKTHTGSPDAPAPPGAAVAKDKVRTGILIVDESKVLQVRLRSMIENLGYEVAGIAADGREGLKMALKLKPKLIILDYMMPEMNGVECLRAIRQLDHDVQVVICAADITHEMSKQFIHAGVSALLTKPINPDRLVDTVRKCMG